MDGVQPPPPRDELASALLSTAPFGVMLCDPAGEILFINEFADHLLGRRPDDRMSADWLRTTHADDVEPVVTNLKAACACGDSRALRHRLIDSDGELRWVDHGVAPFHDADGARIGCVSTFSDVTAEHGAITDLAATRNFTDAVLDTVGALIVVVDLDGRVLTFNKTCESVTGFSADEVIGQSLVDMLVPPEQRDGVTDAISDLMTSNDSRYENDWVTADGGRRRIAWTNTYVTDPEGGVAVVIGTGIDVTDQRLLESRLAQADRLESIGRLTAGIAHDFNNTLATLSLRIGRLSERALDTDSRRDVDAAALTIERTQGLIGDLSSFGRSQVLHPTTFGLNAEIERIVALIVDLLGCEVDIELDLTGDDTTVLVDPVRFEQIVTNLLINARDAMPAGGAITITTSTEIVEAAAGPDLRIPSRLRPGRYVLMAVSDTGVGIATDDLGHVFDPYFTTKPPGSGTGLGLATTYGTIAQSGGAIVVDSKLDHGAKFTVWLPVQPSG